MADLKRYPDEVWDRFFDFAFPCGEELTLAEVEEDLARMGIDVQKAIGRVQQALVTTKAKSQLEEARAARFGILARLKHVAAGTGDFVREKLRTLIEGMTEGTVQAAYFKKLEGAATEADLQSLIEDMCWLDAWPEEPGDAESRTK
jgi:hypothetical protein